MNYIRVAAALLLVGCVGWIVQVDPTVAQLFVAGSVSAPGVAFAVDTDSGLYRIGANDWAAASGGTRILEFTTSGLTATVPHFGPVSTAAAPGYSRSADTDTGVFSHSANAIGVACGGTTITYQDSTGLTVTGSSASSGQHLAAANTAATPNYSISGDLDTGLFSFTANTLGAAVGGVTATYIDSTGRLLIAGSTTYGRLSQLLEVNNLTGTLGGVAMNCYNSTAGTGGAGAVLDFNRSLSSVLGTQAAAASNDALGFIQFRGSDGTAFISATGLRSEVDAATGTNDMPGRLMFYTTADGSASLSERMRIDSAGNVGIGGTANANALLDVSSTTKAFMPPRMTTTQKNAIASPTAGMVVYDTTLNKLSVYTGAAWEVVTSV